jgi:hypothetical protein
MMTSRLLMIRPSHFGFNEETAANNSFQTKIEGMPKEMIQELAIEEYENFVELLQDADIEVLEFEDLPHTPDAVFPNNWFSTFPNKQLFTYPMFSNIRRGERREDILQLLQKEFGYSLNNKLEKLEEENIFLEGTGSLVLDHEKKLAFAAISPRTSPEALEAFAQLSGYKVIDFTAVGPAGEPIYHTNVMMSVGDDFALVGFDTIFEEDHAKIRAALKGKTLIELSNDQIYNHFAGNMLGLQNQQGHRYLVMSATAKRSLSKAQKTTIRSLKLQIIAPALSIIETIGGGSARCMLAELF